MFKEVREIKDELSQSSPSKVFSNLDNSNSKEGQDILNIRATAPIHLICRNCGATKDTLLDIYPKSFKRLNYPIDKCPLCIRDSHTLRVYGDSK